MTFRPQPLPRMTAREKFEAVCASLRICRAIQTEQREATDAERAVLSTYCGLGDTDVRKHAFRYDSEPTPEFQALAAELDLSEAAIGAMKRSTLNAHYTDVGVVEAMWAILQHLGFGELRAPRVLEPSAGVGHFVGCAPYESSDLMEDRVVAVELDQASASVCRALYPRARVHCDGFERVAPTLPPLFDAVVGNVPFGDYRVAEPASATDHAGVQFGSGASSGGGLSHHCSGTIHDYFVCRAVSLLRPGGVAVLITSKGTLDKRTRHVRRWLAERADLVGAFRLPMDAFEANAGTQVTTDVLVLQRLRADRALPNARSAAPLPDWAEWTETSPVKFPGNHGEAEDEVSSYYASHPDHVLGEWCQNKLVWRPDAGVKRRSGNDRPVGEVLRALLGRLPAGILAGAPGSQQDAPRSPAPAAPSLALTTPQELALGRVLRAVRRVAQETA